MSHFASRVAALERASVFFGSPSDLLIRMRAAPDRGAAIFAALSPAQRRAYQEWFRSTPDDLFQAARVAKTLPDGST